MSIVSDIKQARMLALARSQTNLAFLPFSASGLLSEIQADLFSEINQKVQVHFVSRGPLACIADTSESASIYIHQLLNHSETPVAVISLILKHELLHLRIPPRIIDKKEEQHPPEFWVAEKEIVPERNSAWAWIWVNLWSCLRRRPKLQQIDVRATWKKVWSQPKTDLASCQQATTDRLENAEDFGGW